MNPTPPCVIPITSTRATLHGVARHALPTVIEATLVPSALFFIGWVTVGKWAAFAAASIWGYGALARHLRSGQRVPGLLILALVGLTVRTALAVATGSTFLYFAQPIVGTSLMAMIFLGSTLTTRPFVARLAADFYPLTPQIAARGRVKRLFRDLTLLWAVVNLMNAAAALSLLLTLPTGIFIPVDHHPRRRHHGGLVPARGPGRGPGPRGTRRTCPCRPAHRCLSSAPPVPTLSAPGRAQARAGADTVRKGWSCGESNPGPLRCERSALPTALQPRNRVEDSRR
jgi:hypothetical protein